MNKVPSDHSLLYDLLSCIAVYEAVSPYCRFSKLDDHFTVRLLNIYSLFPTFDASNSLQLQHMLSYLTLDLKGHLSSVMPATFEWPSGLSLSFCHHHHCVEEDLLCHVSW